MAVRNSRLYLLHDRIGIAGICKQGAGGVGVNHGGKRTGAINGLTLLLDKAVKKETALLKSRIKKLERNLGIARERSASYYSKMSLYQKDLAVYRSMARKGEIQ